MSVHSVSMGVEETIITEIIRKITSKEGCDYDDHPPLYDAVDAEVLTNLDEAGDVRIEFVYCGYNVILENQEVTITDPN